MSTNDGRNGSSNDDLSLLRAALQDELVVLQTQVERLERLIAPAAADRKRKGPGAARPRLVAVESNRNE